jgi:hypothetical protein
MRHEAWLMLEGRTYAPCQIFHRGAHQHPGFGAIPDRFLLLLAANGSARRRCSVIWRKPRQLGVKFETWLDDRIRASLVPKSGADVA